MSNLFSLPVLLRVLMPVLLSVRFTSSLTAIRQLMIVDKSQPDSSVAYDTPT